MQPKIFSEFQQSPSSVSKDSPDALDKIRSSKLSKKNLFLFNPKMLSKRCGLINENAKLLKVARVPKNK